MPDTETLEKLTLLQQLRAKRTEDVNVLAALVDKRGEARDAFEARDSSEDAKPSDEDRAANAVADEEFGKEFKRREKELETLDQRIAEQEIIERRRQEAASASKGSVSVTSEPLTYRADLEGKVSYFGDLAVAMNSSVSSRSGDPAASLERLNRHAVEMNVELPRRAQGREQRAQAAVDRAETEFTGSIVGGRRRGLAASPFENRVNPNRTDGQGGYFVPPLWLIDEYIKYLRAGRVAAGMVRNLDLPPGTDSINIPKLLTGTATAVQTADGAGVQSTDFTDTSVTAPVRTIAGQQDVAIQLIEQSPGEIIDRVVMQDLMADYNMQVDRQVLLGTGASNQVTGLLPASNWSNYNTVTWTSSAPSGISFNQAVGAGVSKIAYTRYDLGGVAVLTHPRRWFWFATSTDSTNAGTALNARPLVNRQDLAYNVAALENDPTQAEGNVGHFPFGADAYIDGNLPIVATAAGAITAGANDLALVGKFDDAWLFEGSLRTRVLPEVLSGTLQVRFQAFNYVAFLVRYGQSFAVIQGTGMATPVGQDSIAY